MKTHIRIKNSSLEERIAVLENEVAELRAENEKLGRKLEIYAGKITGISPARGREEPFSIEEELRKPVPPVVIAEKYIIPQQHADKKKGSIAKNGCGAMSSGIFAKLINERISAKDRVLVLVDGHNVMNLSGRYSNGSHESQRNAFVSDMAEFRKKLGDAFDLRVYFDGPEESVHGKGKNVSVAFSGGRGNNRADRKIVEYIRFAVSVGNYTKIITVTEDQELRGSAFTEGSLLVYPAQLLPFI